MTLRNLAGFALAVLAAWLLWGGVRAVLFNTSHGSPLIDALVSPPTSILRLMSTFSLLVGGGLALFNRPLGALVALIGTVLFVLMTVAMIMSGALSIMWMDEAVFSGILVVLTGLLFILPRS